MAYFYEMRAIVNEKIQPVVNQMRWANARRQQSLIQGIFNVGKGLVQTKDTYIDEKIPMTKTVSKEPEANLV